MAANSILIPGAIAAKHIDSLNKSCVAAVDVQNGYVVALGTPSVTRQQNEVYNVTTPATATLTTDMFLIVNEPVLVLTNGKYKGLTDDPREFAIAAGTVFNAFKPHIGDEVIISVDGIAGTKGTNGYVVPANGTMKLTWAADTSTASLGLKYIKDTYITVGSERIVGYKFMVVKA